MEEPLSLTALSVAAITGIAAIVGAGTSAIVNLVLGFRTAKTERDKASIEYFNGKIAVLENAKDSIIGVGNQFAVPPGETVDPAQAALAVARFFRHGLQCFEKAGHYLESKVAAELEDKADLLRQSEAYHVLRQNGTISGKSEWKGRPDVLEQQPLLVEMGEYPNTIAKAFSNELRASIQRIERLVS